MITLASIRTIAAGIKEDLVGIRRHLHQHPELSFQEYETSAYIGAILQKLNIPCEQVASTGVVGLVTGTLPSSRVVALRADIDALPITETNAHLSFASVNTGVMHACGHDAHTSSLLGVAMILTQLRDQFAGTVKLIFQPAEEKLPGGAVSMINAGILENPVPEVVIGQHVMPQLPAGKIGIMPGKYMASQDEIYMTIKGKGGHGAVPHELIDPVLIASNIIVSLQQVVSRMADPKNPTVLSFGKFIANGSVNVIPNEVYLEGTFRAMDETWRAEALGRIENMATALAAAMGASCEVNIVHGYPCLVNEPRITALVQSYAEEYFGKENVQPLDIWMAAEDFAYYSQVKDACFYRLGTGNVERNITSLLHTPTFDVDESALEMGAGFMAYVALRYLEEA